MVLSNIIINCVSVGYIDCGLCLDIIIGGMTYFISTDSMLIYQYAIDALDVIIYVYLDMSIVVIELFLFLGVIASINLCGTLSRHINNSLLRRTLNQNVTFILRTILMLIIFHIIL